jgi:hypothetical protein
VVGGALLNLAQTPIRANADRRLFAGFLGYHPIGELLEPSHALHQPGVNAEALTGQSSSRT